MKLVPRRAARRAGAGAAALFAAVAVVGLGGSPAYALADADLAVDITGTTIAANADGKFGALTLRNNGPADVDGAVVAFDISGLDQTKVVLDLPAECTHEATMITCGIDVIIPSGGSQDLDLPLTRQQGATGAAGQLTATVSHAGTDPDSSNDSKTVDVSVGGSGPDFFAFAPDVYQLDEDQNFTDEPIVVGGSSRVYVLVVNQGDGGGQGVRMTITLPEHVTFTEPEPDCTHAAGDSTTTCEYETITLIPADQDTEEGDDKTAGLWFFFPIEVAAGAPAPGALTGGEASAFAMAAEAGVGLLAAPALPDNATEEPPGDEFFDVDPSDNTDGFAVFVAKPASSGTGGSLPITGVQVGVIGAVGVAVIGAGAVLLVLARRRRLVTVVPEDGSVDES